MSTKIAYCSQHVPPEWIAAHGITPLRIIPEMNLNTPLEESEGVCDFMRGFFNSAKHAGADALIATSVCDQMRRGYDLYSTFSQLPTHLFNQPAMWKRASHLKLFRYELKKLSNFLISLGGSTPSNKKLRESMLQYEQNRKLKLQQETTDNHNSSKCYGIGIVGGPITPHQQVLINLFINDGAYVAFDSSEFSNENAPFSYNRRELHESAFDHMAQQWFEANHAIYQRPNTPFYQWLQRRIDQTTPKALILNRWIWCDFWHGESERISSFSPVPVLILDVNRNETSARNSTRVMAFIESLHQERSPF